MYEYDVSKSNMWREVHEQPEIIRHAIDVNLLLKFNKGWYSAVSCPFKPGIKSLLCFLYSIIVEDKT